MKCFVCVFCAGSLLTLGESARAVDLSSIPGLNVAWLGTSPEIASNSMNAGMAETSPDALTAAVDRLTQGTLPADMFKQRASRENVSWTATPSAPAALSPTITGPITPAENVVTPPLVVGTTPGAVLQFAAPDFHPVESSGSTNGSPSFMSTLHNMISTPLPTTNSAAFEASPVMSGPVFDFVR